MDDCDGLENRYTPSSVSRVRIPPPPPWALPRLFNHGTTRKGTEIAPNPTSQIKTADHADERRPPRPSDLDEG